MSVHYTAIGWNRQKKLYDLTLVAGMAAYLAVFVGIGAVVHPQATAETLLIRGFGTLALVLLHVILAIGPLCRLDRRLLPLLYNRRHLGVAMFLMGLAHGAFAWIQFHAFGDVNPVESLLVSNPRFDSVANFPFELLGALALGILFLMAATSHDFWLHNLSPGVWKRLHMLVYAAYGLLIAHVSWGALQSEASPVWAGLLAAGALTLATLHLVAGRREVAADRAGVGGEGFVAVCDFESLAEGRGKTVTVGEERIAVFRHEGKVFALSNVCRHQNGPLGEGRIVDGCVTCPWHGYQYDPGTGMSPPPFDDRVATYEAKVSGKQVLVKLCPK